MIFTFLLDFVFVNIVLISVIKISKCLIIYLADVIDVNVIP